MVRFTTRCLLHIVRAAVFAGMSFGMTKFLNELSPKATYSIIGLWILLGLVQGAVALRCLFNRKLSPAPEGPPFLDGTVGLISMVFAGLVGYSAVWQPPRGFIYDIAHTKGWMTSLADAILIAGMWGINTYIYSFLVRPLLRLLLPSEIKAAINIGREDFKKRQEKIKEALQLFNQDLPDFVELAEGRGERFIRLAFNGEDGMNSPYGLEWDDLGWPDGTLGSKCHEDKFVSRACRLARGVHLAADVIPRPDKQAFCLELSW